MQLTHYPRLGEKVYRTKLDNGLQVIVVPKPGFSRKLAYFVTDFGSIHTEFTLDGETHQVPAGIAHFLEHKLFELPERDVTEEFAAMGANVNAFTSFDITAYYVSCCEHFEDALRLLLEFVSTPYFPEESVLREQGIIDQEIGMNEDSPDSRDFEQLMVQMYRKHGVRVPILGTRQSIREITPEQLALCHRAFYTPDNMVLCVVGDVNPEQVADIATEVLGQERKPAAEKLRPEPEEMTCPQPEGALAMEVAARSFRLGFQCEPPETGEEAAFLDVAGYLAAEVLLGESSPLYLELYEKGLIDSSFGAGFETVDGCAMLLCGGDSDDPNAVKQAILERAEQIAAEGIPQEEFLRLKRGAFGRRIRDLDSFDATCFRLSAYHFLDFDYFTFPQLYESVTAEQVRQLIERIIRKERCAITVTNPIHKEDEP